MFYQVKNHITTYFMALKLQNVQSGRGRERTRREGDLLVISSGKQRIQAVRVKAAGKSVSLAS